VRRLRTGLAIVWIALPGLLVLAFSGPLWFAPVEVALMSATVWALSDRRPTAKKRRR
jgi:polyferredoxin